MNFDELDYRRRAAGDKGTPSATLGGSLQRLGAAYYLTTGAWPLLHMASFEFVTGSKRDRWLVQTVGVLVAVIGAVQLGALRGAPSDDVRRLSAGVALGLAAIELYHWRRGTISLVYALDAVGQLALAGAWTVKRPRRLPLDAASSQERPA